VREIDEITREIVDAAYRLHQRLGPGLLESVYETLLADVLDQRGLTVEHQKSITFEFEGHHFQDGFKVDLLVEGKVVVELKSVEQLAPVHSKQLLTYLRLLNLPVGLLINFGGATFKEGVRRIVNNYRPPSATVLRVNQDTKATVDSANNRENSAPCVSSASPRESSPELSCKD
jgi:iron complex transport system substrate-binding protein